jgi:membrane protein YdbS with pleckstrin-like domain
MQIAQSKTREKFPLSYKKIIKKTITSMIGWFIVFLFISGGIIMFLFSGTLASFGKGSQQFFANSEIAVLAIIILFILAVILNYLYQRWYFAVYFYDLTPDYIQIKKGPITPREITIPYERVQDVYVDQDILDRLFGLYDVHLSSATVSSGMEAHIDGVEKPSADGLRAALLETVKQRISKSKTTSPQLDTQKV